MECGLGPVNGLIDTTQGCFMSSGNQKVERRDCRLIEQSPMKAISERMPEPGPGIAINCGEAKSLRPMKLLSILEPVV